MMAVVRVATPLAVEYERPTVPTQTFAVEGMSCGGCENTVETVLGRLDGISSVAADHEADTVTIETSGAVSAGDVAAAIEDAGYDVVED